MEEDNGVEPSPYRYNGPGFKPGCAPLRPTFLLPYFKSNIKLSCLSSSF
ncbi:hypothetical protein [Escherichia phage vB-Eco-KMB37]|nr:hypothetical protein [Escherichia phage vB-Eco-KMB37]